MAPPRLRPVPKADQIGKIKGKLAPGTAALFVAQQKAEAEQIADQNAREQRRFERERRLQERIVFDSPTTWQSMASLCERGTIVVRAQIRWKMQLGTQWGAPRTPASERTVEVVPVIIEPHEWSPCPQVSEQSASSGMQIAEFLNNDHSDLCRTVPAMVGLLLPPVLNLGGCLNADGLRALVELLGAEGALPNLTGLNVSDNRMGDSGLAELLAALEKGKALNLRALQLQYNSIGSRGLAALVATLTDGHLPMLESIHLQGNTVYNNRRESLEGVTSGRKLVIAMCQSRGIALSL